MKRITLAAVLAAVTVVTAPVLRAADDGARSLDAAFIKAVLAGDAAAAAACYADDAVLVLPGAAAIKGHKAILDALTELMTANTVTDFKLTDNHYRTAGKLSAGWGHYSMVMTPKAGGAAIKDVGTYADVAALRDGKWVYISDHTASDPAPAAPAPSAKKK
jgi:uncharacterized protein (TIGR02246 family)